MTPYHPEQDFHAWAFERARRARRNPLEPEDLDLIAEELEDRARSTKRALKRRLGGMIAHWLKWQSLSAYRTPRFRAALCGQRRVLEDLLEENPSLRAQVPECMEDAHGRGIGYAVQETELPETPFPVPFAETGPKA